jgi:hypothetical protein
LNNEVIEFRGDKLPLRSVVEESSWLALVTKDEAGKLVLDSKSLRNLLIEGPREIPKDSKEIYAWNIKRAVAKVAIEFALRNNLGDGQLMQTIADFKWRIDEDGNGFTLRKPRAEQGGSQGISGTNDHVLGYPMAGYTGRMHSAKHAVNPLPPGEPTDSRIGWNRRPAAEGGLSLADRILAHREKRRREEGRTFSG